MIRRWECVAAGRLGSGGPWIGGGTTGQGRGDFVGREPERELLDGLVGRALGGAGQVVLVAGEPGVGKSRLAAEAAAGAQRLGVRCCWGLATEEEGSPPYWPFRQVVRELSRGGSPGPAADLANLALVAPELVAPELVAPVPAAREPAGPERRFGVFEAVTDLLVGAAGPAGLLVVLDDLQWADRASLQLLVHLAPGAAGSRLMVLATYRDTETGGREPFRQALAALARHAPVTRLRLAGLAEAEVAECLAGMTGWPVPASVAAAVTRRTRGNPFFVRELGRVLAGGPGAAVELPEGVRDAVRGRLARLSAGCRRVVSAAAALGAGVEPAGLAAATGWGLDRVLGALDEAAAAGIVAGPGTGRFGHDLIREAARLEVPTAERLGLHQRLATYLAGRPDAAERAAEVAFHALESLPVGDPALAASWAERAADQAMAQLAWEEAEELYGRAVEAGAAAGLAGPDRCRLLLARARAQVRAFDVEAARRSLLAAVGIARAAGDAETIAEAVLTMEAATDFTWDAAGRALCEEALAGLPDTDSALRARLLALMAVTGSWRSVEAAGPLSAQALAMAERVGDRRALVEALRARQIARSGPDGVADRLALGDRMIAAGERDGDDDAVLWGRLWRFDALSQLGRIGRAEAEVGPIRAVATRLRSPLARWHALRCQAAVALGRGEFGDAEELGRQVLRLAGHQGTVVPSVGFKAMHAAQTGGELTPDEVTLIDSLPIVLRGVLAVWYLATGRREEALRIYRSLDPPDSVPAFVLLPALAGTADLAAAFDDRDRAAEVYRLLVPYADLFVCGGAGVVANLGSVRLTLGVAAGTLGRLDDAVRHLRAAADANDRAGMPPAATSARYELARVLARRGRPGDRDEAAALAASARAVAERLGMAPLLAAAAELSDGLAGRPAGRLTSREREVAVLVSQGLTNRQIGAAGHITERTAENHVQHIMGKLGFTSRAQIAAWVAAGMSTRPE